MNRDSVNRVTDFGHGCRGLTIEEWLLVKIMLRNGESIQEAVRRFRKIVERSGLKRERRRRERYEKPSDVKRKAKNRAIRRAKAQRKAAGQT